MAVAGTPILITQGTLQGSIDHKNSNLHIPENNLLKNGDPGNFEKVSRDPNVWTLNLLKIYKNVLVKCKFSVWVIEKKIT